jgi:hypothetical protein
MITPTLIANIKSTIEVLILENTEGLYTYRHSNSFVFIPIWDRIAWKFILYSGKYHFLFVLIGGALWAMKPKTKGELSI